MRWLLLVLVVPGCRGLDKIPVYDGEDLGTDDDDDTEVCAAERDDVEVACTLDGDTFQMDECGGDSVRLLGVDAPEIAHSEEEQADCWGIEAEDWLRDELEGETVRLTFDRVCKDTYERTLAYAWIDTIVEGEDGEEDEIDSELVNESIIRAGYARVYEEFDDILLRDRLYSAEDAAREDNLGLWAECE